MFSMPRRHLVDEAPLVESGSGVCSGVEVDRREMAARLGVREVDVESAQMRPTKPRRSSFSPRVEQKRDEEKGRTGS